MSPFARRKFSASQVSSPLRRSLLIRRDCPGMGNSGGGVKKGPHFFPAGGTTVARIVVVSVAWNTQQTPCLVNHSDKIKDVSYVQ